MSSLKSLKLRIGSIKSIQKITKAMKIVASVKLKRIRHTSYVLNIYGQKMQQAVQVLASNLHDSTEKLKLVHGHDKSDNYLLIVISSDKGLCGAFNMNICKLVKAKIAELERLNKSVQLICIGKKGYDILKSKYNVIKVYDHLGGKQGPNFEEITKIMESIIEMFEAEQFDVCSIFYNKFKNSMVQIPNELQVIPLSIENISENICEFEPDKEIIIEKLLPKNLAVQLYMAILESISSENAARMTAMENATKNSSEMIKKLNLIYNRTRQANITEELIEIISGAEAI